MSKTHHSTKPIKRKRLKPTAERVRELLHYDPETGIFRWRVDRYSGEYYKTLKARAGDIAGAINDKGYRHIRINNRVYKASHVAWVYMTGEWPKTKTFMIDHKDGNKTNDAWDNLRLSTRSQNGCNRGPQRNNSSGYKGVRKCNDKRKKPFHAQITIDGKNISLGYFSSALEGFYAYRRAARRLHGKFARTDS